MQAIRRALTLSLVMAVGLLVPAAAHAADTGGVHGLEGDYYLSSGPGAFDFAQLEATAIDPNLDFADLEPALQALTGRNDDVSVRWTGRIEPRYSETYTFSMIGDNGFRLWIDGKLVIDHWVDDWDNEQVGTPIALQAGHRYDIKVEYFEHYGGSNLHLSWSSPSQPKEIVPSSALLLPSDYHYDGPTTATVAPNGRRVVLGFDRALAPVPSSIGDHLAIGVNYTPWPVESVALDPGDASRIVVRLAQPIPERAGNTVRVSYDGAGGLAAADGTALPAFNRYVDNGSTYEIATRWAKDVSPSNALPDYPRPQLTRPRWRNLNGTWQFQPAAAGDAPPFGRRLSDRILVPYPPESRLSGIGRHADDMWYRRTFRVPANWLAGHGRLLLHFGAVDYRATVYVNGTRVATHRGGYNAFDADVTSALRRHGPQELVVRASDPTDGGPANQPLGKQRLNPNSIWYTPTSGIWQTVWMEPVPAAHVERLDMTPRLSDDTLRLRVRTSGPGRVTAVAYDGSRQVGAVSGPAGTRLRLPVPRAKLWSPDHPFLYRLEVTLRRGGRTVDRVGSYFGMRSIAVGTYAGQPHLMLNGHFVFELGTLDQGFWPDGIYTAPTDAALRSDLAEEKALGFNTVRKHIKVEPQRWYYWADRLGLLVWQDMPAMDPDHPVGDADKVEFESELHTMIEQHRSHPSIVMWVPFNEGWGEYDPGRIAALVKSWDPSRLVNPDSGMNCCASLPDPGNGDVYDNHTYVGPGVVAPFDERAVVDGEFGGLGLNVPGHTWTGSGFAYETESSATQLSDRYVELLGKVRDLEVDCGLSGAIYTQPTDVELELNGLMTYDRKVLKVDADRVRAVNQSVLAAAGDVQGGTCSAAASAARARRAHTAQARLRPVEP